jgi:serine/threonine-protein kinase
MQLGKYSVSEVLGKGSMGVVYKGFDPHIRRTVALKTIRKELVDEEQAATLLARFRNEAQAAGRLSHPGIVGVYEWGEAGDLAFLAMEYVEGNSLRDYFIRGKRFDGANTVSVMAQLLDALNYAHEQGVWHRDIKPANIIIMGNGKLKVADFGIARIETSNLTQTGAVMGTPGYMAPEQYRGPSVDWRSDLFSAGVVLYQLLTGTRPFTGTAESIAYKICHVEPVPPSEADPERCTTQFDAVTMRALAKQPADRFETAAAFRDALLAAHAAPLNPALSEDTIISELIRPSERREASPVTHPSGGSAPASTPASMPPAATSSGSGQPVTRTIPPPGWDAAVLKTIEQQLSRVVGPVARVMVRRGAAGTTDIDQLYRTLAADIADAGERAAFLAGRKQLQDTETGEAAASAGGRGPGTGLTVQLTAEAIEQAARRLAADLGPIARAVARKAATEATSRRHFHQLLAEKLTDPAERAKFLRDLGSE